MAQTRWRSALMGSGAAIALLASQVPASADEIEELRTQIQSLQNKMGKLEAAQRRKRRVAPAAAVEAGAKPRSWKLPGTNTSMQIGGYAKLDIIYDINGNTGDSIGLHPADGSPAANRQQHFRLHARQSRFWIRTWTPTDWGELETHIQGDFFGAGGNQIVSNSDTFRARHLYGRLGPVLAGQTWSAFMILESLPDVLDFSGPAGTTFIRQAQLRYTHSFGGGTTFVFSIENPETSVGAAFNNTLAGSGVVLNGAPGGVATIGQDPIPDFIVGLTHTWGSGRASIRALFRQINYNDGISISDSVFAWGITGGFGWRFNNRRTAIGMSAYYGRGIGRYTAAAGNAIAVVANGAGSAFSLRTVAQYGGQIWIQHRWTDTLRSNLVYGRIRNDYIQQVTGGKNAGGSATQDNWTIHANLIWRPVPRVDIGVEYIYGFNGLVNSANGELHRVQVSFKYNF
ncbi:MAG: porin [Alphaproteobacteria bacterium]|nr:porin [Alphaproteobacteria bacterium]